MPYSSDYKTYKTHKDYIVYIFLKLRVSCGYTLIVIILSAECLYSLKNFKGEI